MDLGIGRRRARRGAALPVSRFRRYPRRAYQRQPEILRLRFAEDMTRREAAGDTEGSRLAA